MLALWKSLAEELERGRKAFLVIVVASRKGSPGTQQSALLVSESGRTVGTIGGGAMEKRVVRDATKALRSNKSSTQLSVLVHKDLNSESDSGLICGGGQKNWMTVVDRSVLKPVKAFLSALKRGEPGSLTIEGGAWRFSREEGGQEKVRLEGTAGDWRLQLSSFNRRKVAIFGSGHCGMALGRQMRWLNYNVTIVDPGGLRSDASWVDESVRVVEREYESAAGVISHPEITFAVVVTPSYRDDVSALRGLLAQPFPYIGVMGSPSKIVKIRKALADAGFGEENWCRITAPVGLPIESDTPEEIAVSISAQILKEAFKLGLK